MFLNTSWYTYKQIHPLVEYQNPKQHTLLRFVKSKIHFYFVNYLLNFECLVIISEFKVSITFEKWQLTINVNNNWYNLINYN